LYIRYNKHIFLITYIYIYIYIHYIYIYIYNIIIFMVYKYISYIILYMLYKNNIHKGVDFSLYEYVVISIITKSVIMLNKYSK